MDEPQNIDRLILFAAVMFLLGTECLHLIGGSIWTLSQKITLKCGQKNGVNRIFLKNRDEIPVDNFYDLKISKPSSF